MRNQTVKSLLLSILVSQLACGPSSGRGSRDEADPTERLAGRRDALLFVAPAWQMFDARGDDVVPATSYSTGVSDDGAATIQVPIWTPPGRGGVEPKLSLNYSSRAGAGLAGQGFSLSGLSSIERCWKTVATDGRLSTTATPDGFCMGGKHLIRDGSNFAFFPEGDPSTRIKVVGSIDAPDSFTVESSDGLRTFLGSRDGVIGADSKSKIMASVVTLGWIEGEDLVTASNSPAASVAAWFVDRVEDRWGNFMEIDYTRTLSVGPPQTAELVPKQIKYTGNIAAGLPLTREIQFEYRPSVHSSIRRIANIPVVNSQVLSAIKVLAEDRLSNAQIRPASRRLLRRYQLAYQPVAAGERPLDRLTSVTECFAGPGAEFCATPVTFSWKGLNTPRLPSFTTKNSIDPSGLDLPLPFPVHELVFDIADSAVGDFNGDGFDDYLIRVPTGTTGRGPGTPHDLIIVDAAWKLSLGSAQGLTAPVNVSLPASKGAFGSLSPRVMDLDLDGRDDVLLVENAVWAGGVEAQTYDIHQFNGTDFVARHIGETLNVPQLSNTPARSASLTMGDIDGDGIPDITTTDGPVNTPGLTTALRVRRGQIVPGGFSLLGGEQIPTPAGLRPIAGQEKHLLDLNGDGRPELLGRVQAQGAELASPYSVDGLSAFLQSFELRSGVAFENRATSLWARDLTLSVVAESVRGPGCSSQSRDYLTRIFMDVDGDGLRDSVSFPNRERDSCTTVRQWQGSVFVSRNQGGFFTAPVHQTLQAGLGDRLRVGPTLVPESADWIQPSVQPPGHWFWLEDRTVSPMRTIDNGLRIIDYDDDGKQDIMLVGDLVPALGFEPMARKITVALSNGSGFDAPFETNLRGAPSLSGLEPHGPISWFTLGSGPRSARTGDFNGDGRFDIAFIARAPAGGGAAIITHTQDPREPDVIEGVSAGVHTQAATFAFEFLGPQLSGRLSSTACRVQVVGVTPGATETVIQRCPRKMGFVVTKSRREANNFEGTVEFLESTYRYGTPIVDSRGRGFLGFASRDTTTEGLTEAVTTDFSDVFQTANGGFVYSPTKTRTTDVLTSSGSVHSESTNSMTLATSRAGYRLASRTASALTKEASVETSHTSSTVTYDAYGIVTDSHAEWRDASGTVFSSRDVVLDDNIAANETNWLVNRYKTRTDTSREGADQTRRKTAFEYEPSNPRFSKITIEPDAPNETASTNGLKLATEFRYDSVGNLEEIESTNGSDRRLTTFGFDFLDKQFLVATTNPATHQQFFFWNTGLGVQFAADDANNIRERTSFDPFLRPRSTLSGVLASDDVTRGGPEVTYRYTKLVTPQTHEELRTYWLCATSSAEGQSCQLIDPAGHATELNWNNYDGVTSQTVVYDRLGRAVAESLPRKDLRQTPAFVMRSFDRLNRIEEQSRPGESLNSARITQKWTYRPLEVTHTNEQEVDTKTTFDAKGRRVSTSTQEPNTTHSVLVQFKYTTFDQLKRTVHPALNVPMTPAPATTSLETVVDYDVLGRVTSLMDPDLGTETRLYSSFGDLKQTTDANGGVTTFERDSIGRPTRVETPANGHYQARQNGSAMYNTFEWDTATNGVGQLASATSADGVTTDFTYDGFSRSATKTWSMGGAHYQFQQEYDSSGRVSKLHYPSAFTTRPFVLRYDYGYTSAPRSIWDVSGTMPGATPAAPSLLWHAVSQHSSGLIEEQQFGNTTRDTRRFDTGHQLRFIGSTSIQSGASLQKLSYTWEDGLIQSKTDLSTQASEQYEHDFLGRLSRWKVDQNCLQADWRYHYDDWGNLRRRERVAGPGVDVVSAYTSASDLTHPHAVKELIENGTSLSFAYKPGGQAEVVRGKKVLWAPFGLPVEVSDGWGEAKYGYDAFNTRFHTSEKSATGTRDTISIGGLFEQDLSLNTGNVVYSYSVQGPEGTVARVRRDFSAGLVDDVSFVHADHLGSPDTVTSAAGAVLERIKHDPFGERRHPWALAHPVVDSLVLDRSLGFTGHSSSDGFGLTDMRGRIYDPHAGAFISADPIQHQTARGLSRMSYVHNSPVLMTDPSGFDGNPVREVKFDDFDVTAKLPNKPEKITAASLTGTAGQLPNRAATNDQGTPVVGDDRLASENVLEAIGAGAGAFGRGVAVGLGVTLVLSTLPFTATAALIGLGTVLITYQLANGGAERIRDGAIRAVGRIANGKVTIGDVKEGAFFAGTLAGGGAGANHLANTASARAGAAMLAQLEGGLEAGPLAGGGPWIPNGPSGPWVPPVVRPGGAVVQTTPTSCGAACVEMISNGERTQAAVIESVGEGPHFIDQLVAELGAGWRGGGFGSGAHALHFANRGPMIAQLWAPETGMGHFVVTEPVAGGFLVRDPWPGVNYTVTSSWIEQWVVGGVGKGW